MFARFGIFTSEPASTTAVCNPNNNKGHAREWRGSGGKRATQVKCILNMPNQQQCSLDARLLYVALTFAGLVPVPLVVLPVGASGLPPRSARWTWSIWARCRSPRAMPGVYRIAATFSETLSCQQRAAGLKYQVQLKLGSLQTLQLHRTLSFHGHRIQAWNSRLEATADKQGALWHGRKKSRQAKHPRHKFNRHAEMTGMILPEQNKNMKRPRAQLFCTRFIFPTDTCQLATYNLRGLPRR